MRLPLPLCGPCCPAQDRFAADLDAELRRLAQDAPCEGGFVGFGSVAEIALGGADMGGVDERKFAARGDADVRRSGWAVGVLMVGGV